MRKPAAKPRPKPRKPSAAALRKKLDTAQKQMEAAKTISQTYKARRKAARIDESLWGKTKEFPELKPIMQRARKIAWAADRKMDRLGVQTVSLGKLLSGGK